MPKPRPARLPKKGKSEMPNLTIQGTKVNRVFDAKVEILHDLDEDKKVREAVQVPVMQFTVTLPLDHETQIAMWALAPQGPKRFKTVELQTLDRSKTVKKDVDFAQSLCAYLRGKRVPGRLDQRNRPGQLCGSGHSRGHGPKQPRLQR